MNLASELQNLIEGGVLYDEKTLDEYSRDASLYRIVPEVVVRPKHVEDVKKLTKFVKQKREAGENVSLTPRSAGTDMSGGPLTASIVVDVKAHMNNFLGMEEENGEWVAEVEPGMYFRDFDAKTKEKNLEMPGYPASRNIASIGGMVANNAGGEKNIKYGKTANYVREIDIVLDDGEVHTIKPLAGDALAQKLQEESYEGELYRKLAALITENTTTIEEAKPKVTKNSSGYALWDAGGGVDSLDLTKLITGSQGTFGIITRLKMGLVKPQDKSAMLIVFMKSLDELSTIIPETLKAEPDSFESYDDNTFKLAVKYFPEFAAQMKAGIVGLGVSFLPEMVMMATGGVPKLVLMIEFRADEQDAALKKAEDLMGVLKDKRVSSKMRIAKDEKATRKYWTIRRESFNLLRKKVRGKRTAPFIEDFVVPPLSLPEFLPRLDEILAPYKSKMLHTIAGHVGSGNFHLIPLVDPKEPGLKEMFHDLSVKTYELVREYGGTLSGEHNDGLVRTPYVKLIFGEKMNALFEKVEKIFDPLDIFNPGKKVGTSVEEAEKHLDLPEHSG